MTRTITNIADLRRYAEELEQSKKTVHVNQHWRKPPTARIADEAAVEFAMDMARDVPLTVALETAAAKPDDIRCLLIAAFVTLAAIVDPARRANT
jgi:hypothetical protein